MNKTRWIVLAVLGSAAAFAFAPGLLRAGEPTEQVQDPVVRAEATLLHAQRFELEEPYIHYWRSERPRYTSGWLLVIEADRQLLRVSQGEMPILYVGSQTAERINLGTESGRVVVLVPGDFEITEAPIFFGDPGLPERVDLGRAHRELDRARARGVRAPTADTMVEVLQDTVRVQNDFELRRAALTLIERFSPQERELIDGMRTRVVK